jgi:DNA-binding Lrp family transcriptional regulator
MDDAFVSLATIAAATGWRVGRASLGFILDTIAVSRGANDILDPLILSVVLEANVAAISQDPVLQRRYASVDAPPPDELRRAVSISAVAASLRLPYETVRRRISRLAKSGACSITPRGVMITAERVSDPAYLVVATARYERLRRFYRELKALGVLSNLPRPPADVAITEPPIRIGNRAISEYMLRVMDQMMLRLGDPLTGLILLEMARANAEHLPVQSVAVEGPVPDAARHPIRTLTLAKRLGLPSETVRRHVARLEQEGFCRRVDGGRLAALEQLAKPDGRGHGLEDNMSNVQRLFAKLASLGVVAFWDAEENAEI